MKYIITERQHRFLIEQEIPNWFKRRFNAESMEEYITKAEINHPMLCDDFNDGFEYADNIITDAVRDFMTTDEDIFDDERYDEWEERLIEMCKEKFGERLFEVYRTTCQEDDEMMFESDDKNNRINKLVFNYLDGQNFKYWDEGDGEFNLSDGDNGGDVIKYRIQNSSIEPDHEFEVLYVDDYLVERINELFSMVDRESVRKVIAWFNKTYDKKLTPDDYEWMVNSDTFYAGDDDDN
jgi:hypothetical protein